MLIGSQNQGRRAAVNHLKFEQLNSDQHERLSFDCGAENLNIFLKLYAFQQQKQGFCKTFVCIDQNSPHEIKPILGYYTISASSIEAINADYFSKKKLPYKSIPTVKIGRLARDINVTPKGFGKYISNGLKPMLGVCLKSYWDLGN